MFIEAKPKMKPPTLREIHSGSTFKKKGFEANCFFVNFQDKCQNSRLNMVYKIEQTTDFLAGRIVSQIGNFNLNIT